MNIIKTHFWDYFMDNFDDRMHVPFLLPMPHMWQFYQNELQSYLLSTVMFLIINMLSL